MWQSRALCTALALAIGGCGNEIVLGDSESPLPVAGAGASSGAMSAGAAAGVMSGSSGAPTGGGGSGAGGSGGSGAIAGSAGMSGMPDDTILPPGDVVWSTDHEVGDFSDWQRGGAYYGGEYEWGTVNGYVDLGIGRKGSNGVVADINTQPKDEPSGGVRMYRRIESGPAYYSAWFRLEDAHKVIDKTADWWSIFLFHSRDNSLSLDNDVSLWDVRIVDTPDSDMELQFFDHDLMLGTLAGKSARIVSKQWFEITAYLDYRPPDATRVQILLNGILLYDMKGLHTAAQANVFWSIGNGAAGLDPPDSTIDLDDAAIRKAAAP
jgi:hypothetical protein